MSGQAIRDAVDETISGIRLRHARHTTRRHGPKRRDGAWRVADGWITTDLVDLAKQCPKVGVIDLETSGFDPVHDRIIEIGLVVIGDDGTTCEWSTLVNPRRRVRTKILALTGIDSRDLREAPDIGEAMSELARRIPDGATLAAYGAGFDRAFLQNAAIRTYPSLRAMEWGCVLELARKTLVGSRRPGSFKLASVCENTGVRLDQAHRAVDDARATATLLKTLLHEPKATGRRPR